MRRDSGTLICSLSEGRSGTLVRESVVQKSPLLVVGEIREISARGNREQTLLSLASAVELDWVRNLFPDELTTRAECEFDPGPKRVEAFEIIRFRDLELGRERAKEADPQAAGQALAKACLGEWFTPKSFDHSIRQLIRRLNWLCAARPDLEFPPLDVTAILNCLSNAFAGMTLAKQAVAADVKPAFRKHMPREQWEWLDEFAPQTIAWPDDKPKRLEYPERAGGQTRQSTPGGVAREAARLLPLGRASAHLRWRTHRAVQAVDPEKQGRSITATTGRHSSNANIRESEKTSWPSSPAWAGYDFLK